MDIFFLDNQVRGRNYSEHNTASNLDFSIPSTLGPSGIRIKKENNSIFYIDNELDDSTLSLNSQVQYISLTLGLNNTSRTLITTRRNPMALKTRSWGCSEALQMIQTLISPWPPTGLLFQHAIILPMKLTTMDVAVICAPYSRTTTCRWFSCDRIRSSQTSSSAIRRTEPRLGKSSSYTWCVRFYFSPSFTKKDQDPQFKRRAAGNVANGGGRTTASHVIALRKHRQGTSVSENEEYLSPETSPSNENIKRFQFFFYFREWHYPVLRWLRASQAS